MCLDQLLPKESYVVQGGEETLLLHIPGFAVKSLPLHSNEKVVPSKEVDIIQPSKMQSFSLTREMSLPTCPCT